MKHISLLIILTLLFAGSLTSIAQAADVASGKVKYDMLCTACHGASGKGDGVAGAALNPKASNLITSKMSDADMTKIIKEGGASMGRSPLMAAWKHALNDADIANVVAYIKQLQKAGK